MPQAGAALESPTCASPARQGLQYKAAATCDIRTREAARKRHSPPGLQYQGAYLSHYQPKKLLCLAIRLSTTKKRI